MTKPENDIAKFDLRSEDIAEARRQELLRLFPEAHTESGGIDFQALRLSLGDAVESGPEGFGMSWPGKAECSKTIQRQSVATLLPVEEESVNWDTTQNVIIEGDNLEVLKVLQKAYLGKVKMIYIDPPYNTGNDFIYPDNYMESLKTYLQYTGQVDDEGRKFSTNTESSGRFHSKWMNMMYPRLSLARDLLRDDGLLFVSINDAEQSRVRSLCDEIFGEENFLATLIWMKGKEGGNDNIGFGQHHEYIICYAKIVKVGGSTLELDEKDETRHITKLPEANRVVKGEEIYKDGELFQLINLSKQKDYKVDIPLNDGKIITWDSYSPQKSIDELIRIGKIFVGKKGVPYVKSFMSDEKQGTKPSSVIESSYGTTKAGGIAIRELFGNGKIFSYPKPPSLIQRLIKISGTMGQDDLIVDFFAGSGTTGHAVMAQNLLDGGSRRFVLVQLPEEVVQGSDAYEAGFENLTEICRARVKRAASKLAGEFPMISSDLGFRSFKLQESNFAVWDANAIEGDEAKLQQQLFAQVEHILPGRTNQDILFELMLKSRYELTTPAEVVKIGKCEIWKVAGGEMIAVIDSGLTVDVVREIATMKPVSVVILDRCFAADDSLKANARKILEDAKVDLKTV